MTILQIKDYPDGTDHKTALERKNNLYKINQLLSGKSDLTARIMEFSTTLHF